MQEENNDDLYSEVNSRLPVIFVDALAASMREDGLHYLKLGTVLPDGIQEQARLMIPDEDLRIMLDTLCEQSDYYPVKQSKPSITKNKKRKSSKPK